MSDDPLRPLWWLSTGVVTSCAAAALATSPGPTWATPALVALAVAAAATAFVGGRRPPLIFLALGLALGAAAGVASHRGELATARTLAEVDDAALRVTATVAEGWSPSRFGRRTRVTVSAATWNDAPLDLPRHLPLEVRGATAADPLPAPGSPVAALVRLVGIDDRPLLVASSPRLVTASGPAAGMAALRDRLQAALLAAAGCDVRRIGAAELAAGLILGRRDLIPAARRDGWRRSGLAHMLAVSGLHVGLVAGVLVLLTRLLRLDPNPARLAVMVAVPLYALLAGAAPSAVRAAVMVEVYLLARLLGRALVPLAAVLLAAVALLLADPGLVADAGFQLTVGITAALVRWTAPLAARLPGPRWLATTLAVPVVAQLAATPIVAWHFRAVVPAAVASNLAVPLLLAPALVAAGLATLVAPLWPAAAGLCLELVALAERGLWLAGTWARAGSMVTPPPALAVVLATVACAWLALQPERRGRIGAASYVAIGLLGLAPWSLLAPARTPTVAILPVVDGLAATVSSGGSALLFDGGRWAGEAGELLAASGPRRFRAVIASHTDEDHVGGLPAILATGASERLVVPAWMTADPLALPLLRAARRGGAQVIRVARGNRVDLGGMVLEILWPPTDVSGLATDNERSLVARVLVPGGGPVLATADIGRAVEARLVASTRVAGEVLVVAHHGSRESSSRSFLNAVRPRVALIPVGLANTHGHPHREVLTRLRVAGAVIRSTDRDGRCGVRLVDGEWVPFP